MGAAHAHLLTHYSPKQQLNADLVRNTVANARRPSTASSRGSSRSASFSLPDKGVVYPGQPSSPAQAIPALLGATYANTSGNAHAHAHGDEAGVFADSDDEGLDEEAKAHKRDFEKKRAMHYGQEAALALKKAREMAEEDEAAEADEDAAVPPVPPLPNGANGV